MPPRLDEGVAHVLNGKTMRRAVWLGKTECLLYLASAGCPWPLRICDVAATHGHLDCIRIAHSHGNRVDAQTMSLSAKYGHMACLEYLHTVGCAWDATVADAAAKHERYACLHYLHRHGCPVSEETRHVLARRIWLPMWRARVHTHRIFEYWRECAGKRSYGPDGEGRKRDREAYEADFA